MNIGDMENWIRSQEGKVKPKEVEASADDLEFGVQVVIDNMVFQKIMYWVHKSNFEVSGLGKVVYDRETNVIRVIDAIILPQKNTSTTTDIDGAAVGKAMFMLRNTPGELRWWWHSHVDMGVFWSGTDISTIKQLGSGGWFAATVFNKKQQTKSAFCQNGPIRLLVPEIPTVVASAASADLMKQWDDEYEKNVENASHSFRGKFEEQKDEQETTQEAQEAIEEDEEWVEVTDEDGNILSYHKRKKNKIPVPRRSLAERNLVREEDHTIETKPGQETQEDLASISELQRWERSSSDEEAKDEIDDDIKDAWELMTEKDYGD